MSASENCASDLYVDEVLAVLDDVDVSAVDGLLVVFDAGRPVGGGAQDLREERETMGSGVCVEVYSTTFLKAK